MRFRKLLAVLLIFMLSLSILTACGNSHKADSKTEETTEDEFETMDEDTEYDDVYVDEPSESGSGASLDDAAIMSANDIDYSVYSGVWTSTGIGLEV